MLLQESRRAARSSAEGEVVLLEDQDRSLWNQEQIAEGSALGGAGPCHRGKSGPRRWKRPLPRCMPRPPTAPRPTGRKSLACTTGAGAGLVNPSAVVELNRAVAVAMRDGPAAGLPLIEAILERGDLEDYYLGELCARRPEPAAGENRRSARRIRAVAQACAAGAGAPISRAAA